MFLVFLNLFCTCFCSPEKVIQNIFLVFFGCCVFLKQLQGFFVFFNLKHLLSISSLEHSYVLGQKNQKNQKGLTVFLMKILMKFKKIFTKLYIFYFFKKTNRSLEKQSESFDPFDSFEFFDPKHNYAVKIKFL